jgi:hypothetical protein
VGKVKSWPTFAEATAGKKVRKRECRKVGKIKLKRNKKNIFS